DLRPLLSPDSVAVIGASADTETLRGRLTHALIGHGYDGRVFPVTRSQSEVLGLRAYPSVAALPEPVDLAVILVPAAHVVEMLEQCGQRRIRAAVVISSGFAEESNEAARARDVELSRIAERHGIVVCGPNSEGIVNPFRPLVATFSPVFHDPSQSLLPAVRKARPIAVSCQSGALTFSFLSRGRDRQLHFTHQVSAGNQTILEAHDYIDWWLDEGSAEIFLLYLEGIRRPDRFLVLPAAARQPCRGDHRIRRQRGVDGRYPLGARARTPGSGGRHPETGARSPAVLRVGAKPGRRDRASNPRGRLRAAGRDRA